MSSEFSSSSETRHQLASFSHLFIDSLHKLLTSTEHVLGPVLGTGYPGWSLPQTLRPSAGSHNPPTELPPHLHSLPASWCLRSTPTSIGCLTAALRHEEVANLPSVTHHTVIVFSRICLPCLTMSISKSGATAYWELSPRTQYGAGISAELWNLGISVWSHCIIQQSRMSTSCV